MSEKIARLGIERDNDLMYYIKGGDVWATPRKQPGRPKGKARMVEPAGIEMDYSKYLYFLDGDGDIARKARGASKGAKKPAKVTKAAAKVSKLSPELAHADCPGCPECPPCPPTTGKKPSGGKKSSSSGAWFTSPAVLEREIAEVLGTKKRGKKPTKRGR